MFFKLAPVFALGFFVVGCDNASPEKAATTEASAKAVSDTPAPLQVVSAALPKPIDMGPLPVPADPAVLMPQPPDSAASKPAVSANLGEKQGKEPPSVRPAITTPPGPMAPRTPPTM